MTAPRILVFAGSNRTGSFNRKLAALAALRIAEAGGDVTTISLADFPLPIYDGDEEARDGVPGNARALHRLFAAQAGIFIASPEYNSSFPPLLKNTLDWISRVRDDGGMAAAFGAPVFALGAASNSPRGGYRCLMQLRQMMEHGLGASVIPPMVAVHGAAAGFDEAGHLVDAGLSKQLDSVARRLIEEARRRMA